MIISDKQKEFIRNAHHRFNLKIGARRCGKTYLDNLYTIPKRILERKGKDGLNVILGVSKGTIERNVLQPLRQIYGNELVSTINSQNIATLFGEEVYCLGAEKVNQVSKIQGTSIKYCYGDEVAKWSQEVFIMVQGSLDKPYSCFDGALNPENQSHWLKRDFLDLVEEKGLDVYVQHYTIFDNPFLPKEFVENLCKEYPSTIWFSGHSHWKWYLQKYQATENVYQNEQEGSYCVHISGCASPIDSNGQPNTSGARVTKPLESEGAIVDVYENYIDIRCMDLKNMLYLPIAQYRLMMKNTM